MKSIQKYIYKQVAEKRLSKEDAKAMLLDLQKSGTVAEIKQDYVVIGMSGKMPAADNLDQYWDNLWNNKNSISEFPDSRRRDAGSLLVSEREQYRRGGYLKEIDKFDPQFFKISPREAKYMHPMQRLLLQTAYEAIEDAGYGGDRIYGTNTGVYVGVESTSIADYNQLFPQADSLMFTGSMNGILASRISFQFNLTGPSMVIDTACSSSLSAIITACQALENKQCDMAVVGGACLTLLPSPKDNMMNMVESEDDQIKAFDQNASGTSWGEAVGSVVIKPLANALKDGDSIHAVIKGWAINNDGASNGITAPNAKAQESVILKAWDAARINPETIQYIETHGTGTILGDPIEIRGITNAFRKFTDKKQFCAIGSVKTEIGHTVGASGMASVLKVILMLKHKKLVASLNFNRPNKYINFIESPVYVNDQLCDWKRGQEARRAGISAFGFSGTNCHMILEEAPHENDKDDIMRVKVNVFTISAKNEESLRKYVCKYYEFLSEHSASKLSDICFTANTGRGHYNYRLLIICESLTQLIEKLGSIVSAGLTDNQEDGIYYGVYQVVSSQAVTQVHDITEEQKNQLSEAANKKIEEYLLKSDREVLREICQTYISGADLNWDVLYRSQNHYKVHLPTYPYHEIRCWADTEDKITTHPFIDCCAVDSICSTIYKTMFSVSRHWILSEHKVNGCCTVPGVTYIEMAVELGRKNFVSNSWEIQDLVFFHPLVVDAKKDKEVHTVIQKHDSYFEFTIAGRQKEQWTKHAEGKLVPIYKPMDSYLDVSELMQSCVEKAAKEYTYEGTERIDVGPRWNVVQYLKYGKNEILAYLKLPDEYQHDMDEFFLHPALLDCAVNAAIRLIGEGLYLPWGYRSIKVYSKMPKECYGYLRRKDRGSDHAEAATFDITIADMNGKVVIEVTGYSVKKVNHKSSDSFYQIGWSRQELKWDINSRKEGSILVIKGTDRQGDILIKELKDRSKRIIEVSIGDQYEEIDENTYKIAPYEASYLVLMKRLKEENIVCILHLLSLSQHETETVQQLETNKLSGVLSLYYLSRALLFSRFKQELDIVLIARQVNEVTKQEEELYPQAAALFGLGKVIMQEYPKLKCRSIDIDNNTYIKEILREVEYGSVNNLVAYRNGHRYVEELQNFEVEKMPERDFKIQSEGAYVITGGLGGIGLVVANYLAGKNKVNLILLSRSEFPEKSSWKEILEIKKDKRIITKIKAVQKIEETGSQVSLYRVDVSDEAALKEAFMDIRRIYGKINGVIHSAGLAGDGFIINKSEEAFQQVLKPKMNGTWLLDQVTKEDDLDFFILFSSIITLFGGVGQGDYTAANTYMDAYAAFRNKKGKPALCINWPAWKDTGMAVNYGVNQDGVFKAISNDEAIQGFDRVISSSANRVIIGSIDRNKYRNESLPIQTTWSDSHIDENEAVSAASDQSTPYVKLMGKVNGDYSSTEKNIANIWGNVLGISTINVYDNFEKIGGNSILAIKLLKEIEQLYPNQVGIADLFTYSTVNKLSDFIEEMQEAEKHTYMKEDEKLMDILNKLKEGNISIDESLRSLE